MPKAPDQNLIPNTNKTTPELVNSTEFQQAQRDAKLQKLYVLFKGFDPSKSSKRDQDIDEIMSYEKTGDLLNLIKSFDLSNREDLQIFLIIADAFRIEGGKKIRNKDGSLLFPNGRIESHLYFPLELTGILEQFNSVSLAERMQLNGHEIVKISSESLTYWAHRNEQKGYVEILSSASPENSHALLATLIISIDIASQSLNRYSPGSFIVELVGHAQKSNGSLKDLFDRHPNSQTLRGLLKSQEDLLTIWNEVFRKYLSHIIQNPQYVFQAKNELMQSEDLLAYAQYAEDRLDIRTSDSLMQKIKESVENNIFCPEIEAEASEIIEITRKFQAVLENYNNRMDYARPGGSGIIQ